MAQQSILVTAVGSTNATPAQFTAASPCDAPYLMTSTFQQYGDVVGGVANAGGIVPLGYINVQYHNNNQWVTGTVYTKQTGAQIKVLIEA